MPTSPAPSFIGIRSRAVGCSAYLWGHQHGTCRFEWGTTIPRRKCAVYSPVVPVLGDCILGWVVGVPA